ncbi:MAG: hypothetical protein ABSH42_15360 [Bryobacteraceae bacterium]|jgi:hypothetical protein
MESEGAARLRTATWGDADAIGQLMERNGLGALDRAAWRTQWEAYPFAAEFRDVAIGWVLETETGGVVGYLGNVHMLYDLCGRSVKGAITTAWAVDASHRSRSLQLMIAFLKQKNVDLWLDGSASLTASRVLTGMKVARIPVAGYEVPCFWAARPRGFAKAVLLRRAIPGAGILAAPAGMLLNARDTILRSGRGRVSSTMQRLGDFDDRFETFWQNLRADPPRLRAVRTRAVLEWRFGAQLRNRCATIVAAGRDGNLTGYAVLIRRQFPDLGMDLYDVADLQSIRDDPATIRDLLLGAIAIAREDGVDAVKFMTGTPAKRAPADELRPYTYRLAFWQLYYKVQATELKAALATADAWDFSLFDTY